MKRGKHLPSCHFIHLDCSELQVALYIISPKRSYNFSELLEAHAVDTYGRFLLLTQLIVCLYLMENGRSRDDSLAVSLSWPWHLRWTCPLFKMNMQDWRDYVVCTMKLSLFSNHTNIAATGHRRVCGCKWTIVERASATPCCCAILQFTRPVHVSFPSFIALKQSKNTKVDIKHLNMLIEVCASSQLVTLYVTPHALHSGLWYSYSNMTRLAFDSCCVS